MKFLLTFAILILCIGSTFAQTEQTPLVEKEINYKNWKFKGVRDDKEVNLREFVTGKKLTLVVYFAPWCKNWKYEAPFVQKMYDKYKSAGFDVIAVANYGTMDELKTHIEFFKFNFPIVYETLEESAREKTTHYKYRKELGDTRNWGSPWNLFIEPANLKKDGDTIVKKAFIAQGELIEVEAEKFIREKLGLPAVEAKATTAKKEIEACEGEKKTSEFKKP